MSHKVRRAARLLALIAFLCSTVAAKADDGIFPATAAAKPFIDFDGRGFKINGQRTFIVSGSLHYPRVPRALWRDRLLRFKRAGFNTVQTYAFWNFHEPQQGKWDFSGDKDLDAFLKLVKALGMYAVVRPGPYVCAEWDSGGYPVWLRFVPGLRVREDNAPFEAAVDRWYEHVLPIIARNQINHGGAVIMVQLENEHPQGWGRDMPNNYFRHLRDKALALGLEVPYFFSGLHHGSDPAGNNPWDSKGRANPWYSTEFWPGWYSDYGPLNAGDFRRFDRGAWKIIAYGGNGWNFYMLHGGTNFDYYNNDEDASSYDYGAAVGQAGDLRPIYYRFKRAAWFARSFQDVLEDSENATDDFKDAATGAGLRVTARRSPAGTILFLDNNSNAPVQTQVKAEGGASFPSQGSITVAPGEIMPVVTNYQLTPDVKLDMCAARVLGIVHQGDVTTLVVYGPHSDSAELRFGVPAQGVTIKGGASALAAVPGDASHLSLKIGFPTEGPDGRTYSFTAGRRTIRVLSLTDTAADHTWFVETNGQTQIFNGPDYIGDEVTQNGRTSLLAESYPLGATGTQTPVLSAWQSFTSPEIQSRFNDATWKASDQPLQMGADGDISAYAWYRASIRAPKAGSYNLNFADAGDWLCAFVNGTKADSSKVRVRGNNPAPRTLKVTLNAGDNALSVLAAHYGRDKLFNHLGPVDQVDAKGINGPVTLSQGAALGGTAITGWKWKAEPRGGAAATDALTGDLLANGGEGWQDATVGQDVFNHQRATAWFRVMLPDAPGPKRRLHFESVDDNGTVYLNGHKLLRHEGWDQPFDVPLDDAWHDGGPNVLAVLVENNDGTGGIGAAELQSLPAAAADGSDAVRGWKMRGGVNGPNPNDPALKTAIWKPLAQNMAGIGTLNAPGSGVPIFYRAIFNGTPLGSIGAYPIWRVVLPGMSRGFVWLNGHNLGRYPEKVAVNGLYLPECWIKRGANTLVVFDEEGNAPSSVKIVPEAAASRSVRLLPVGALPGG